MKNIPKISVLMITYNQENVVRRSLDSLIAQKEYIYEICINDDCSTDKTFNILKEYEQKYPNLVKPVRNEHNLGIFRNVEETWKRPKGDIITRLSGDDECGTDYYRKVIEFIIDRNIDYKNELFCIYCDYIQRNNDGATLLNRNSLVNIASPLKLKIRKLLFGRGVCYSRHILEKFENVSTGRSYSVELIQDCQIQLYAEKSYYIPCVGNIYNAQKGVSMRLNKSEREENIFQAYDLYVDFVAKHGHPLDFKDISYINYMKSFRKGKKIQTLYYYIKSIDVKLGMAGFQLDRVWFVFRHRLLKKWLSVKNSRS